MSNIVSSAVKNIYIDAIGDMYMLRFDGTSKFVGKIVQEADYSIDDPLDLKYILNRPLDNSNVKNASIRYDDGAAFVGTSEMEPVEIASQKRDSLAFNVLDFKSGVFFAAGDTVLFNDVLWLCTRSGMQYNNPSVSKSFTLVHKYEFAQKICELDDTRLSALITAEDGTVSATRRIDSIFDLYFYTEKIDLPNNETPEEFKYYATVADGQVAVGASAKAPSILAITFAGKKTVSFSINVFDVMDNNPSTLLIAKDAIELHRFECNIDGQMTWNGVDMVGNKIIDDIAVSLDYNEKLYISYDSTGVPEESLPFIISNLSVSYTN